MSENYVNLNSDALISNFMSYINLELKYIENKIVYVYKDLSRV